MYKSTKSEGRVTGAPEPADWMAILRLDKKKFEILIREINLHYSYNSPIPDPRQRLITTLRYLITGEGYHASLVDMFDITFNEILESLEGNLKVNIRNVNKSS